MFGTPAERRKLAEDMAADLDSRGQENPGADALEKAIIDGEAAGKIGLTVDKHGNVNLPPQRERDTGGATSIRQAMKRTGHRGKPGRQHTPSLEEAYGSLIKQGLVKIVRKRGRAPQVIFLRPGQVL